MRKSADTFNGPVLPFFAWIMRNMETGETMPDTIANTKRESILEGGCLEPSRWKPVRIIVVEKDSRWV